MISCNPPWQSPDWIMSQVFFEGESSLSLNTWAEILDAYSGFSFQVSLWGTGCWITWPSVKWGRGEINYLLLRSLCINGAQICTVPIIGTVLYIGWITWYTESTEPIKGSAVECSPLCSVMCSEVQWLWEQRDVKSASTVATAVFLTPPEHTSIAPVVMANHKHLVSHITTVQLNWQNFHY